MSLQSMGTTGTLTRPAHTVAGPALTFDLARETAQLRNEIATTPIDRHAKTLSKEADFSIVLLVMEEGAVVRQHTVPAEIALHTLSGHLRVDTSAQQFDLLAGELVVLEAGVPFKLEAHRGSSFLLIVARHALEAFTPLTKHAAADAPHDESFEMVEAEISKVSHRFLEKRTPFLELTFQSNDEVYYQRWVGERVSQFFDHIRVRDPQLLEGMRCKLKISGNMAEFVSLIDGNDGATQTEAAPRAFMVKEAALRSTISEMERDPSKAPGWAGPGEEGRKNVEEALKNVKALEVETEGDS